MTIFISIRYLNIFSSQLFLWGSLFILSKAPCVVFEEFLWIDGYIDVPTLSVRY